MKKIAMLLLLLSLAPVCYGPDHRGGERMVVYDQSRN